MRAFRISISIPQFVIERIQSGYQYVRTGINIHGDELVAVSEQYLNACVASRKEQLLGAAGGLLCGISIVLLTTAILLPRAISRLIFGLALGSVGGYCLRHQRKLKNARELFRKSEEARRIDA